MVNKKFDTGGIRTRAIELTWAVESGWIAALEHGVVGGTRAAWPPARGERGEIGQGAPGRVDPPIARTQFGVHRGTQH